MFRKIATILVTTSLLAACGGGGSSSPGGGGGPIRAVVSPSPAVVASPSPAASSTPGSNATTAFTCPTSDATTEPTSSVKRSTGSLASTRHFVRRASAGATSASGTTRLTVVYNASAFKAPPAGHTVTTAETAAGATLVAQIALSKDNHLMRVLNVPAASAAKAAAALRAQSGVVSVGTGSYKRFALSTTPYYTNDPYFQGFTAQQNATAGQPTAGATYEQLPYAENANVPGQWDMHAIGLEHAFGYSQPSNGSNVTNANAVGSTSVNIAIIDTGEDANHPELASKIVRQRCFITNSADTAQSTSNYSLDPDGHGTDVSGIAAADTNNAFGFAGAGGNVNIFAYRVFPTPDDTCYTDPSTTDPQCGADTADIASAITDAVGAGAQIISMSLGGGGGTGNSGCTSGGIDSDPTEEAAIQYAINHNVIVVAAAGNSGSGGAGVAAPGCDAGVIAVGATALDDGQPNSTGSFGGSATTPVEYVAAYSQYGSPASNPGSANAWGIVAPGGDPSGDTDSDFLHWVFNIWTTTPYESSASDTDYLGTCTPDYPNVNATSGTLDCTTLIAGTSMATPHVAGAAALILSVSGSQYATPALMKGLLCSTADSLNVNGSAPNQGCGRLNIYRAMATALGDSSPPT